ncbi:PaaI family thioesterase [Streptomyces akebiae]|uniref:Acyl-coenzyme A thioesterase THEM4 n=1 Tax=Streptomyces akebiae TaxID=2865673 RepID=A0ABX8Y1K3_9ACTN|nr:PaaI family thioesterase [Streptomyces akebiae]QYX81778.1 PaaI family thioesterase [Streptomyces akebiae]
MNSPLSASSRTPQDPAAENLKHQREAIAALGHELRLLVDATVRTEASPETTQRLADGVRALTGQLIGRRRSPADIPEVDEFPGGVRMYSPVTGPGSPMAPPMRVAPYEGGVVGRCLLGIAHEGPPGYGHGGISAMLLDELMGWACAAAGRPGMTISLQTRYRGPVPLETPLRVRAHVTATDDRKIYTKGSIATEEAPSTVLVEADGIFVAPDPDVARALFPILDNAQ